MKSLYALIFVLALAGNAFAFTVTVPEETIVVPVGGHVDVDVNVFSSTVDSISLTVLENKPWITQSDTILKLAAGEGKTMRLSIEPSIGSDNSIPYRITLLAESPTSGQQRKYIYISVSGVELVDTKTVLSGSNFAPTDHVGISSTFINYKDTTVENVKVVTNVKSPSLNIVQFEQIIDSIDAGESKNISYTFTIPRNSGQGIYFVDTTISYDGFTRTSTKSFKVNETGKFTEDVVQLPSLFGFRKKVTVTNVGNNVSNYMVTEKITGLDSSFLSGDTPNTEYNGEYTWMLLGIAPGESRSVTYGVDYSPVILLLLAVGVGSWVYMFKIRTVRVKKYIMEKKFIEEGEEFTVGIEVINTSGAKTDSATVRDFVPSIFDIKEMDGPKPSRKKVATGTELIWNVKDLHNNEERVFSYKMIPVFGIHGQIRLPQASVTFKKGKNEIENRSFFATIGIEMESYKDKGRKKF